MSHLAEKTLSSEELVRGKLLHVYRDEVEVPGKGRGTREWVNHPGASAVIPIFEDGTTILLRQFRYAPRREFFEVPAGKLDVAGEDPEDVARRELEEETGWKAERFTSLGSFHPCIGYSNEVIHFFLAEGLTPGSLNLSEGELVEEVRMPFEDAVRMARRGELLDMKTFTALLLAEELLSARAKKR